MLSIACKFLYSSVYSFINPPFSESKATKNICYLFECRVKTCGGIKAFKILGPSPPLPLANYFLISFLLYEPTIATIRSCGAKDTESFDGWPLCLLCDPGNCYEMVFFRWTNASRKHVAWFMYIRHRKPLGATVKFTAIN